jgi:hypothetical protein
MSTLFLSIAALFISIGRFTIPGHALTGWPGAYEALAHILLGAMIAVAALRAESRLYAIVLVVALTVIEVLMFKAQA